MAHALKTLGKDWRPVDCLLRLHLRRLDVIGCPSGHHVVGPGTVLVGVVQMLLQKVPGLDVGLVLVAGGLQGGVRARGRLANHKLTVTFWCMCVEEVN